MSNKIREGIEVLAEYGWRKNAFGNAKNGFCILGAVRETMGGQMFCHNIFNTNEHSTLRDVILEQFPDRVNPLSDVVPNFNDHDSTKIEDVILVMEKAAIKMDEVVA